MEPQANNRTSPYKFSLFHRVCADCFTLLWQVIMPFPGVAWHISWLGFPYPLTFVVQSEHRSDCAWITTGLGPLHLFFERKVLWVAWKKLATAFWRRLNSKILTRHLSGFLPVLVDLDIHKKWKWGQFRPHPLWWKGRGPARIQTAYVFLLKRLYAKSVKKLRLGFSHPILLSRGRQLRCQPRRRRVKKWVLLSYRASSIFSSPVLRPGPIKSPFSFRRRDYG